MYLEKPSKAECATQAIKSVDRRQGRHVDRERSAEGDVPMIETGGVSAGTVPVTRPRAYGFGAILIGALFGLIACDGDSLTDQSADELAQGRDIFRFETFGDETFWTDTLGIHEVIQTAVSPQAALAVGLKVDADALP